MRSVLLTAWVLSALFRSSDAVCPAQCGVGQYCTPANACANDPNVAQCAAAAPGGCPAGQNCQLGAATCIPDPNAARCPAPGAVGACTPGNICTTPPTAAACIPDPNNAACAPPGPGQCTGVQICNVPANCANDPNQPAPPPPRSRCQTPAGALTPIATACADEDPAQCATIFGPTPPPPAVRPAACDQTIMAGAALKCARTCSICCERPEYSCPDKPPAGDPNYCQTNIASCTDPAFKAIMQDACPGTCGLCSATAACTDQSANCAASAALCTNVNFKDRMEKICARTCNAPVCTTGVTTPPGTGTPGGVAPDTASNCATNAYLCNNAMYRTIMQQNCATTCAAATSNCRDTNANCANWQTRAFCSSTFYTQAQKQQYCARTCNLC